MPRDTSASLLAELDVLEALLPTQPPGSNSSSSSSMPASQAAAAPAATSAPAATRAPAAQAAAAPAATSAPAATPAPAAQAAAAPVATSAPAATPAPAAQAAAAPSATSASAATPPPAAQAAAEPATAETRAAPARSPARWRNKRLRPSEPQSPKRSSPSRSPTPVHPLQPCELQAANFEALRSIAEQLTESQQEQTSQPAGAPKKRPRTPPTSKFPAAAPPPAAKAKPSKAPAAPAPTAPPAKARPKTITSLHAAPVAHEQQAAAASGADLRPPEGWRRANEHWREGTQRFGDRGFGGKNWWFAMRQAARENNTLGEFFSKYPAPYAKPKPAGWKSSGRRDF
eukprot:TRINITY_DN12529_c0_g1_i12.p2 TRINITY_DN12529_c0_g1~~TRINITY_DN12529_c0_g1_i12.p2  ORF type:complete len:343 (-),score=108.75 TRINITY_DN12529_c0_g1_i12:1504-2532(-)